MIQESGLKIHDSGFKNLDQDSEFRIQDRADPTRIHSGFRTQDSGLMIQESGFRIQYSTFWIENSGLRIRDGDA